MRRSGAYVLKYVGAEVSRTRGHGLSERVRVNVPVVGIEEAQKNALWVDEWTHVDDLFRGYEPLIRFVPSVTRHLISHLVDTRRSGRDTNAAGTMKTDFLRGINELIDE